MNYNRLFLVVTLLAGSNLALASIQSPNALNNCNILIQHSRLIPKSTNQLIIVKAHKGFYGEMYTCERRNQGWVQVLNPSVKVVIGKKGIISPDKKKEGDLKTPAGLYSLGEAFGFQPLALKMDFRYITADDKYIDDAKANNYNQWVIGNTRAKSYETMLIPPYKMGIIVNYNKKPTIPGSGSAIFIHLWRNERTGTHGCIATDENHLLKILHWLDKSKHPSIYIF